MFITNKRMMEDGSAVVEVREWVERVRLKVIDRRVPDELRNLGVDGTAAYLKRRRRSSDSVSDRLSALGVAVEGSLRPKVSLTRYGCAA